MQYFVVFLAFVRQAAWKLFISLALSANGITILLLLCSLLWIHSPTTLAQKSSPKTSSKAASSTPSSSLSTPADKPEWLKPLSVDSAVKIGKLANGLTYYIRTNRKPEKRAEINLVVNAGSILEDDSQQGLAHFCEHMAFNGTKNFQKQELVNYLEKVGMRFGPDLNAYTSFDETVYLLQIPTDSATLIKNAFRILEDWASNVSFDAVEIEKERGVVLEEWRLGRGASERMLNKQLPIIFKNSRYAERLPIGKKEILEKFSHETLRRFYRDWYRPDLMAVIAVGDFDAATIEALIQEHFGRLNNPPQPKPRFVADVPDHKDLLITIATDAEAPMSTVQLYAKTAVQRDSTVGDYRRNLVDALYNGMLSARLQELTQKPNPPFSFGGSGKGRFVRSKSVFALGAYFVKDNDIKRALEVLYTEAERVRRYGFTASELKRQKESLLRQLETAFAERDKTESRRFASEYAQHFLQNESIPGIATEFALAKELLPTIELTEVNSRSAQVQSMANSVIVVQMPQKDSVRVPTESELRQVIASVSKLPAKAIAPYEDNVSEEPLVEKEPTPGRISITKEIPAIGAVEWKFRNGVRVIAKQTDFKNDEIVFQAFSPGGTSVISDERTSALYPSARFAASVIDQSGLGKFDDIMLRKRLTGKVVSVSPYINELYEGFEGSCSPKDLETALQLIYGYFVAPRRDANALAAFKERIKGFLVNQRNSPESAFFDSVAVTVDNYHPRRKPLQVEDIERINLDSAMTFYTERFADASDFTFIFVGNFALDALKSLTEKYLGSLPALRRNESWRDIGVRAPKGIVEKTVKKGVEPKSLVHLSITGDFAWSTTEVLSLDALSEVMKIRLREVLREDMGGVYGVSVSGSPRRYPRPEYTFLVRFGCAPERVDELVNAVMRQLDSAKQMPVGSDYITKVKEIRRRAHETSLKENSYWVDNIESALMNNGTDGGGFTNIVEFDTRTEMISADMIQQAANKYLNTTNMVKVVLYPEKVTAAGEQKPAQKKPSPASKKANTP